MNPMYVARDLARQLRDDRIATSQIKEFISVAELIELLDLKDEDLLEYLQVDLKKDE
jgi:hypothetical protein